MKTVERKDSNCLKSCRGMTLIELLVAFMVFVMLIAALVALTTVSLDTWTEGEARKDIYDRAQIVLETLADDFRNAYGENQVHFVGQQELQAPVFACDLDNHRRQRVRFIRTGNPSSGRLNPPLPQGQQLVAPPMYYADLWEVSYHADPDPRRNALWRGLRPFNRSVASSLLTPSTTQLGDPKIFQQVDPGVLYVGYRFWTQYTTTWDDRVRVQKLGPASSQASGPEIRWDSQRKGDKQFTFNKKYDVTNPDFVYPEIVQITIVLESTASLEYGIRLAEACDGSATTLRLTDTGGLPDAPGMVKIGAEWVEYRDKGLTELTGVRRGMRGTAQEAHAVKDVVHFGESFTTDVRIAAFREAQQP